MIGLVVQILIVMVQMVIQLAVAIAQLLAQLLVPLIGMAARVFLALMEMLARLLVALARILGRLLLRLVGQAWGSLRSHRATSATPVPRATLVAGIGGRAHSRGSDVLRKPKTHARPRFHARRVPGVRSEHD